MQELDFTIELHAEDIEQDSEVALFNIADQFLRDLAEGHTDMTGAAISIEIPAHGETPPLYEVTVIVYARPNNIAATKKTPDVFGALNESLEAVERQIRNKRERLKKHWEQPSSGPVHREVTEVMASEDEFDLPDISTS